MNMKTGLILSIVINIILAVLIGYVKKDAHQQAKDYVKPILENAKLYVNQENEIRDNNAVIWDMTIQFINEPSKDLTTLTRIAKAVRLPGKENEAAFLKIEATSVEGKKARKIGWEKRSITFVFDEKDQLVQIDAKDILNQLDPEGELPVMEE